MALRRIDLTGQKFGRITAIRETEARRKPNGAPVRMYLCACECGTEKVISLEKLRSGETKSCGCLQAEITASRSIIHGYNKQGKRSKVYRAWCHMRQRCQNKNDKSYPDYGGRGISVCNRWETFENFLADMGEPLRHQSIDRIDNDGNYEPGNCRWADGETQRKNTRRNVFIEIDGVSLCVEDWGRKVGIDPETIRARLKYGWNEIDAVMKPLNARKSRRRI